MELEDVSFSDYDVTFFFNSQNDSAKDSKQHNFKKILLVIGPEGGLGEEEINYLKSVQNIKEITLNIPIMRTPTALSCAVGYVLGSK